MPTSAIFGHIFAIFRCFLGPLVPKLLHILVQLISFDLSGVTSKQLRIGFRNKQRVIEPHEHVKHDNFENFTKLLKIAYFGV